MLDRITSLEVLAKVASSGSFSGAARAMGLSQTMVTRHIGALETRLGARLLHRTTRRVWLTEAGQNYLEATTRALADLEAAESAIGCDRFEARGVLRLNAPMSFGARHIAPLLPEFARQNPKVVVELGLNDRLVDLAEEGWDLAIRIGALADSQLVARRLAPLRSIVCAAPAYLVEHGTPRRVAELADHNCLGYTLSRVHGPDRWTFGARGDVEIAVSGNLRANNGDALREAAIAGQGIVYQPTFIVADDLMSGRLTPIALDHPPIELGAVHAVYPPQRHPPAKVRAFIDFLVARFSPGPPWDRALADLRQPPGESR